MLGHHKIEDYSANILVIGNNPNNHRVLSEMLFQEGYNPHPAIGGESALSVVENCLSDLILLDIRMPGMDGYA